MECDHVSSIIDYFPETDRYLVECKYCAERWIDA